MIRAVVLVLLALAATTVARGQAVMAGSVSDAADGEPLAGAVVRAYVSGKIKAFASVKSDGTYSLRLPQLQADSIDISVQCIGYDKMSRRIANRSSKEDFRLAASSTALREVQVSVPRINQLGDTLIYNLASYLGKSDVTLEDGLKKLPGIEVEGNGKINYQGKGISNFYIEGMDMLGGRYSQATRNLPAAYVTDVEVLGNHHDAKIDRDSHTDDVAINVRLKSHVKFKPVGISEALVGYGGDRWLYGVGATGMMFTPRFQTMLSVKVGNFKQFALGDLHEHIVLRRISDSKEGIASKALGSIGGSTPPLSPSRYISPMDRLVSLSFMNKFGEERSMKVNASYAYSATDYSYSQSSAYYTGGSEVVVDERSVPFSHTHNPSIELNYTDNGDTRHLFNRLSASGIFISNDFNTLSDNLDLHQRKKLKAFDLNNDFSWRIKTGRRIWGLGLSVAFNRAPETDLRISDAADSSRSALQTMSGTTLQSEASANTSWLFGRWTLRLPLSLRYRHDEVGSHLVGTDDSNDVRGNRVQAAVSPAFEYTAPGRRYEFSGSVSAGFLLFHAENRTDNAEIDYGRPYFNPAVRFKYNFTPNFSVLLNSGFNHSIGDVLDLLTEPIMTSWRSRKSASGILARQESFTSAIGLDFKKPMDFWFANADLRYDDSRRNLLSSQHVSSSVVTSGALASDNSSQNISVRLSVTKQFVDLGIKATIGGSCSWSRSEMMQQDRAIPYYGRMFSLTPRLNVVPWSWMEFDWKASYTKTFNRYLNVRDSYDTMGNELHLSLYPFDGWDFFGEAELMRKQLADGRRKEISLFDLGISYRTKRVKLTLRADNILDTRSYYYSIYSGLDTFTYGYALRPRTISIGVTLMK